MNKKILKVVVFLSCLLLVTSIVLSCAIAQNHHHLDNCNELECTYCNTIHIAQEIIYKIFISGFQVVFIFAITYIVFKIYTYEFIKIHESLVSQNVQLNE